MATATIKSLNIGQHGIVREVKADPAIRQRLFDMGIFSNTEVIKERTALLGDPIWIRVGDIQIALRANEAEAVTVEV